jgi:hypothetical protein
MNAKDVCLPAIPWESEPMGDRWAKDKPRAYRIRVRGRLDGAWADWFDGLARAFEGGGDGTTILTTVALDQAALRGLLCRLWDLNLALLSVSPLADGGSTSQAGPEYGLEEREVW